MCSFADAVATNTSLKVLQGKSFCTLARSASDPKQQLSAYVKALETLGQRFERVDCLVEMGEWATGRGLARCGSDYLRSALDLLYDVEVCHKGRGGHCTVPCLA